MEDAEPEGGLLSDLREVQCLICCLLHQMFIADPNIAKLVHFQVIQCEGDGVDRTFYLFHFTMTVGGLEEKKNIKEQALVKKMYPTNSLLCCFWSLSAMLLKIPLSHVDPISHHILPWH